ncbi:hypothetical protein QT519_09805 [Pseudomonas aeruginosa]|nr:hypothetical protein [Pseudomonas aeruginosa]MDM5015243.1 hypothetical protein [Pseudomonas aeruginosa]
MDKFVVRLPDGLRAEVEAEAKRDERTCTPYPSFPLPDSGRVRPGAAPPDPLPPPPGRRNIKTKNNHSAQHHHPPPARFSVSGGATPSPLLGRGAATFFLRWFY